MTPRLPLRPAALPGRPPWIGLLREMAQTLSPPAEDLAAAAEARERCEPWSVYVRGVRLVVRYESPPPAE